MQNTISQEGLDTLLVCSPALYVCPEFFGDGWLFQVRPVRYRIILVTDIVIILFM